MHIEKAREKFEMKQERWVGVRLKRSSWAESETKGFFLRAVGSH